jgi:hypothetical protein
MDKIKISQQHATDYAGLRMLNLQMEIGKNRVFPKWKNRNLHAIRNAKDITS